MPYTNRYSSYQGLNNYKSYSYTTPIPRTQPPISAWTRPPRYMPTSSSLTFTTPSKVVSTTIETTTPAVQPVTTIVSTTTQRTTLAPLPPAVTDELHTEVDYNILEIDNIMICREGKLIEIQSGELSSKKGLISKCLFINNLLKAASLSEMHLCNDPAFVANESKAIIKFLRIRDAEEFINSHNDRYRIVLQNSSDAPESLRQSCTTTVSSNKPVGAAATTTSIVTSLPVSYNCARAAVPTFEYDKNSSKCDLTSRVKIDDVVTKTTFNTNRASDYIAEPINGQTTVSFTFSDDSSSNSNSNNNKMVSSNSFNDNFNDDVNFETNIETGDNSVVVKRDQVEGYETLTIKAKLKQRVGPNRKTHVQLKDIDSIMRNVVTVVQNEFMKRFPSATSVNCSSNNLASITDY